MWLLLFSCQPTTKQQLSLSWSWLNSDPHVHSSVGSNDTDGLGTPDRLQAAMQAANLDVIWLTDHSNSQGSMHCDDVEDCPNLGPETSTGDWPINVFIATEISPRATSENLSEPTGHIGCLPLEEELQVSEFIDRPFGTVSGANAIEQCSNAEGWPILNHPFGPAPWVAFDQSANNFTAVEVFNGGSGFDLFDVEAVYFWETGIAQGHSWVPIAASDCHKWNTPSPGSILDPALGWPMTKIGIVNSESPLEALIAGRVLLGDPSSTLFYWVENGIDVAGPSETINGPVTLHIEHSSIEDDMQLQVVQLGNGIIHHDVSTIELQTHSIELTSGVYYVRLWPHEPGIQTRGFAMGNTITVQ
jgi:hypothetical protein